MARYALGLDFGTNSARALIADVATGAEAAAAVSVFPSGEEGVVLDERNDLLARQHPNDWLIAMERAVRSAMKKARGRRSFSPERVIGIGVDTTGSTPLPLDRSGVPLAMHRRFGKELAAMAWLWKDHTSYQEAAEITALAKKRRPAFLKKCGGAYSSEWFFSKILHCMRTSPEVFEAAYTWAECSDYIPAVLTGTTSTELMKRNSCAAGHKCMYNESWGGLPDKKFLGALAPEMAELRGRLFERAVPADRPAGGLSKEWARRLRLVEGTPVAVGSIDAHMGALGSGVAPGTLVKIIGTSTCDMMVAPKNKPLPDIPGIAGIADDSIIPGMYGLEAGQSAVGDIFNWFVRELAPRGMSHDELTARALRMKPGECGLLALDWNNGNRNVLADFRLTGMLLGQTLHTGAAEVYRALIEATAFGARMIVERVEEYGVPGAGAWRMHYRRGRGRGAPFGAGRAKGHGGGEEEGVQARAEEPQGLQRAVRAIHRASRRLRRSEKERPSNRGRIDPRSALAWGLSRSVNDRDDKDKRAKRCRQSLLRCCLFAPGSLDGELNMDSRVTFMSPGNGFAPLRPCVLVQGPCIPLFVTAQASNPKKAPPPPPR